LVRRGGIVIATVALLLPLQVSAQKGGDHLHDLRFFIVYSLTQHIIETKN
jgi:hypothetical protein